MKKRRYSITASEEDTVPVIASYFKNRKGGLPRNTNLALLACDDCNHQVLGSHSASPFCICCASDMKVISDEDLPVSDEALKNDFKEIAQCKECDTVVAVQKDIVASFDDKAFYCQTCAASIQLKADDSDEEDSDTDSESNSDTDTDTDSDSDMSDTVDENTDDNGDSDSTLFDNDSDEGDSDDNSDDNDSTDTSTGNGSDDTSSDDGSSTDSDNDSAEDTSSSDTGGTLSADLVKMVSGREGDLSIVASPDKSKWFLFFNNMPIASASKDNASDNVKAIFDNDKFNTAWNAAIADGVSQDTLDNFGFTALTTDVPVDEAVKQNMEASIEDFKNKHSMTAADVRNRYERCVGIAAVGINKQVFKENNPVLKSLTASLTGMRVRNAEKILLKAFEEHGEEYLANIAEKASELMDKSDETLDELAKTVDDAKYSKIEENTNSNQQPKITPFPKAAEPKINDKEDEDKTVELAASDTTDIDSKVERMFSAMRHRNRG